MEQSNAQEPNQMTILSSQSPTKPSVSSLSRRRKTLNSSGHSRPNDKKWNQKIRELKAYINEHGDCNIKRGSRNDKTSLAHWVSRQRCQYVQKQKGKKNCLSDARIAQLESMGFEWKESRVDQWKTRFKELQDFRNEFGHCKVPQKYPSNLQLGKWVQLQRYEHDLRTKGKHSRMNDERISELQRLGFVWKCGTRTSSVNRHRDSSAATRVFDIQELSTGNQPPPAANNINNHLATNNPNDTNFSHRINEPSRAEFREIDQYLSTINSLQEEVALLRNWNSQSQTKIKELAQALEASNEQYHKVMIDLSQEQKSRRLAESRLLDQLRPR
jgi:hypothetical protein